MSLTYDQLIASVLELSDEERIRLVSELLATLPPATPSQNLSEQEWIAEIKRRAREALAGSPGTPWEEVRAKIEKRLQGS